VPRSRRWTEPPETGRPDLGDDAGSASLEFITAGMLLLIPIVYLVLAVSAIEAGVLAIEGAARQAARVYVQAPTAGEAEAAAERAIGFALADHGLEDVAVDVAISCTENPCLTRRGFVTVTVSAAIPLPLVPPILDVDVPLAVPLEATATQQVSRFWGGR